MDYDYEDLMESNIDEIKKLVFTIVAEEADEYDNIFKSDSITLEF